MRAVPGWWRRARPLAVAALLAVLVWRAGTGPVVAALARVDVLTVTTALALTAVSTVSCAWRWRLVARALRLDVPLGAAVAACYRAQLLNATLPGGVLGDVHRGVQHGRGQGDVPAALRAVAWERTAGQLLTVPLAAAVLLVVPSPLRPAGPVAVALGVLALVVAVALLALTAHRRRDRSARARPQDRPGALRTVRDDVRGLLGARVLPGVLVASAVATAGHVGVFLVAAHAAGATTPVLQLVPLALVVLVGSALPLNVAGWGPREGTAAWAFGTAGLGAAQGLTVAVLFGLLALVGSGPGALVLARGRRRAMPESGPETM